MISELIRPEKNKGIRVWGEQEKCYIFGTNGHIGGWVPEALEKIPNL